MPNSSYRIGVDIGGTFTDVVAIDQTTGDLHIRKVPTVPADPARGFMNGFEGTLERSGIDARAVAFTVHGTTVATNTIIENKGARVGLITSEGFSDVLEIAYQIRPSVYDIFYDKPAPLVPRQLCIGVPERIDADGMVHIALDEAAVADAANRLERQGVEAVVVAFLHSYRDPTHEQRAAAIIRRLYPELMVVASSEICPEYREYPRTSTAVVNALLLPKVGSYIARLETLLAERGIASGLHLMTSAGGCLTSAIAREQPVQLIESGPAAGVIGAAFIAGLAGHRDLLALDMGGTTTKAALVIGGAPRVADQFEVGAKAVASNTANRGQGYPVRTPVLEIIEIGAGGGSVAKIDPGGSLSIGPESMGADPGPACYALGGDQPTITDANIVLGRLNPDYFLGGEMVLEPVRAQRAIEERIAVRLGLGVVESANAIIEIGVAKMAAALFLVSVRRGVDPRQCTLVATGGASPLHAAAIARQLHVDRILVPPTPGLISALGLLATDLKHEFAHTVMTMTRAAHWARITALFNAMVARARSLLEREGVASAAMRFSRELDMCYLGQAYQLRVQAPDGELGAQSRPTLEDAFHRAHRAAYAFANEAEATQIVNLRLTAIGAVARPSIRPVATRSPADAAARKGFRRVYFHDAGDFVESALYERSLLRAGDVVHGPAIVEQMDSTTVIPPNARAEVDAIGNLIISFGRAQ